MLLATNIRTTLNGYKNKTKLLLHVRKGKNVYFGTAIIHPSEMSLTPGLLSLQVA